MNKIFKLTSCILSAIIIFLLMFNFLITTKAEAEITDSTNSEIIINNMVNAIQEKDWSTYTGLMSSEEQGFYEYYFNDDTYTDGIKQIETIELNSIHSITVKEAGSSLLVNDYPILSTSSNVQVFIVALDCTVSRETQYFYNGINYYLVALAEENGEMKVAQFNRLSADLADKVIIPELDKKDAKYNEKKAAINVIDCANIGFLVNGDEKLITKGFKVKIRRKDTDKITALNDYPNLDLYLYYSVPTYITCEMNKTGSGEVVKKSFDYYCKNVINNEWINGWKTASLKTGAYCIKGVAWYKSINPVNANYMVTQGTQMYKPDTALDNTDAIFDAIDDMFMVNYKYVLFFPTYGQGTEGVAGTKAGGLVSQYGSQYLAEKGYSYSYILNYYYSGSEKSSDGDVEFVDTSIIVT